MHRLLSLWPRHWGAYWQLIQKQFRGSWNLTIIKPNLKPLLGSAAKTNSTLSCMLFCLNAQCDCSGFFFFLVFTYHLQKYREGLLWDIIDQDFKKYPVGFTNYYATAVHWFGFVTWRVVGQFSIVMQSCNRVRFCFEYLYKNNNSSSIILTLHWAICFYSLCQLYSMSSTPR